MRSPQEIAFRLAQEGGNLYRLFYPPHAARAAKAPLAGLPDPAAVVARLSSTPGAAAIVPLAEDVLAHRFPLLAYEIETGPEIHWRGDYISRRASGVDYFRRIPYLDFSTVGDHKIIWELNRHQHLTLLGQAWHLSGRDQFVREIEAQLDSWWGANPTGYGINWASALEVAFRALSWIWVYHLCGDAFSQRTRRRFFDSIYAHGRHIEGNLSVYFSPNTHLMGEAVALHALGVLLPDLPRAQRWKRQGRELVLDQMRGQVQADGSHFEHSSYYHVYALDMLMFAAAIDPMPSDYMESLARMAEYLDVLLGPQRRLPFFSDDDGGRLFHPYGPRDGFGLASLDAFAGGGERYPEIGAWWLGGRALGKAARPAGSRFFNNSGMAVMQAADVHLIADAGPFGTGRGGHSHADTLSFVLRRGDEDLLVDAGTYTYVGSPKERNWFRGTAAHNTVRIDGLDQATPEGPFRWADKPQVDLAAWNADEKSDSLAAICRYRGFEHLRRIEFVKPGLVLVVDDVTGPPGEHLVEQFWHAGENVREDSRRSFRIGRTARLSLSHSGELSCGGEHGWRSRVMGSKEEAPVIRVELRATLPVQFVAVIDLDGNADAGAISAALEQLGVKSGGALG